MSQFERNTDGTYKSMMKPDGTWTIYVNEYIDAWHEILDPLEDLGFKIVSYDPDIELSDGRCKGYVGTFVLPVYAAKILLKDLQKK
jgi:hypothetical protein